MRYSPRPPAPRNPLHPKDVRACARPLRTRRLDASPHDNAGLPPMHHDDRTVVARGECLPPMRSPMHHDDRMHAASHGAVQCTTEIECMPLRLAQSNGTTKTECGCGERDCFDAGRTRDHASRTRREGASPLLLPRGCTPSLPAFLHRGENGHFLLIPHIPQKGSFDSLNLERHLTFRLSSPTGRFSFPVFPDVLKGFPFFARSIIEPMFCVLQSRPAS